MARRIMVPETNRRAKQQAWHIWTAATRALVAALHHALPRKNRGRVAAEKLIAKILAISKRCAALPDRDRREPEVILGYDETGGFS